MIDQFPTPDPDQPRAQATPDTGQVQPPAPVAASRHIWSDDDAATISLSGCLSFLFLSLLWFGVYAQTLGDQETVQGLLQGTSQQSGLLLIGSLLASAIAFLGSAYFAGVRKHPLGWRSVGLRSTSRRWLLGSLLAGVGFVPVNIMIVAVVQRAAGLPVIQASDSQFEAFPVIEFAAVLIAAAVLVPFAEEVIFRGVIYRWLRTRAGLPLALIISSVIFGSLHFYLPSMVAISLLGMVCGLLMEYSGSLWPAVVAHGVNNALAVILSYFIFSSPLGV
jgi:hypothetical protein